jgi:phosphatidylserine/phosphatidylglycerophosphate/cardiolipin synthase-like enzyme/membrane protein DedA with SNARE-associated domain
VEKIFKPQKNCWQVKKAHRASFLIDGEVYFRALHETMQQARQSIMIVGWDLHSGLRLLPNDENVDCPRTLGKFLDYLARKRKELNIYLLSWDFSMIYAMEREFFPRYKLKWLTHRRIHFCLDGEHPIGASQHQKVIVIDDAVAFSGGFDLSKWRWDTPEHLPDNELRVDPDGNSYPPFHDVQMVVDGEAAFALAQLVRQRWQRACGELPLEVNQRRVDAPWPDSVKPDFKETSVAICRTLPQYKEYDEIREVERLYLDSIAQARRYIYIENQYLSSYRIGEALKERLIDEDGPEVIMVLPLKTGGWIEQHTMDVLRGRILRILMEADLHDRLRVYFPRLAMDSDITLMVHAKIMVIDDCFVRVGSANLSNRSLGFDSECDLAIAGEEGSDTAQVISSFRNRLLAEHLGVSVAEVAEVVEAVAGHGSLIEAVESLRGGDRTLMPFAEKVNEKHEKLDQWLPESELLDPEKPLEPEEFLDYLIRPEHQRPAYRQFLKIIITIAMVLALAALWRWTPLGRYLNIETVTGTAMWLKVHPLSPVLVPFCYVVLGVISFPVTLLIMVTIIVYGPWWGIWYAMLGTTLSAVMMFLLGHLLGKNIVSKFSGSLINRVNQRLSQAGLMAVIFFRIIPVAPFSLINLIAGVSAISLRDFFLGTLIGIIPGIAAIAFLADRLTESLRQPDLLSFTILFAVIAVLGAGLVGFRRWLKQRYVRRNQHNGS